MKHRLTVYVLVIASFGLLAWMGVMMAREHAETAQLYADSARLLYQTKVQNLRARVLLLEARANYRKALASHAGAHLRTE